jgi:hypothetical protein
LTKEEQFLKVEIKLADKILDQFKEEAFIVIKVEHNFLPKIRSLLSIDNIEESSNKLYEIIPGEGIWPYEGALCPSYCANIAFDPIPLIIGLDKIREFLIQWEPEE